jgi:WhiB family transcriptional regulator, redox-sensing transcriptional regulator
MSDRDFGRLTAVEPTYWRDRAACRHADPELFFPIGTTGPALAQIAVARQVCEECPVRACCLRWAMTHEVHGIWGGATEEERQALRRRTAKRLPSRRN